MAGLRVFCRIFVETLSTMQTDIMEIAALVLAGLGVGCTFVPRLPHVLVGYASMLVMHFAGAPAIDGRMLLFWGVAAAIVLAVDWLQPRALTAARQGHGYVAGGTLVGAAWGYLISPSQATIIAGAFLGAFLGAMAYMRTPSGPRFGLASREFVQYTCAKGLPDIVTVSMALTTASAAI